MIILLVLLSALVLSMEAKEWSDTEIVAGSAFCIVMIGCCVMAPFYCWMHRQCIQKKLRIFLHKASMKNIKDYKGNFSQNLQATPARAQHILEGLEKIEILLQEEADCPDAWEEAYKFLVRFHGSIRRIDRPIWHMFSRYLYLKTKKIIDKHGWSSPMPIINDNQTGLIRALAVRLLSISINDPTNVESEKMILAGFRELEWKGRSQYPHAGLLWPLICLIRPIPSKNKEKPTGTEYFDKAYYTYWLRNILRGYYKGDHDVHVPPSEVIPQFGSVAQQAAFALGSIPDANYLKRHSYEIMFDTQENEKGAVPKSYFAGILHSLYRSSLVSVMEGFDMRSGSNPAWLDEMAKVAPIAEWNRIVNDGVRELVYYGRYSEAKKLHDLFMPNDKDTGFFMMQQEQQLFEGAIEKGKEDIRAWFAARTDKEEFKQKPAPCIHPKIKLDKQAFVPPSKY